MGDAVTLLIGSLIRSVWGIGAYKALCAYRCQQVLTSMSVPLYVLIYLGLATCVVRS